MKLFVIHGSDSLIRTRVFSSKHKAARALREMSDFESWQFEVEVFSKSGRLFQAIYAPGVVVRCEPVEVEN